MPKAVPVKDDENDRQEAAFRWAPEDREHAQAEKIDRLEREAAAAMRDNERLRKQVEVERDETIAALRDGEALRAALKDASNRAADARARSVAADAGRAAAEARAASARAEASHVRERTTRTRGDAAAAAELARAKDAKAQRLQADLDALRKRHDALLDSTVLAAGGGRVAQVLRSNVGPSSKPLEKVVKPEKPPLQKQDDVAALLSRVGALEGQVLALRTAKKAEAQKPQPRPPPPADPDRPVPQSKALGALAVVVGEQMSTETDRLRAENQRLREEMARLVLRGVLPPPPRAPAPAAPDPPRRERPAGYFNDSSDDEGGDDECGEDQTTLYTFYNRQFYKFGKLKDGKPGWVRCYNRVAKVPNGKVLGAMVAGAEGWPTGDELFKKVSTDKIVVLSGKMKEDDETFKNVWYLLVEVDGQSDKQDHLIVRHIPKKVYMELWDHIKKDDKMATSSLLTMAAHDNNVKPINPQINGFVKVTGESAPKSGMVTEQKPKGAPSEKKDATTKKGAAAPAKKPDDKKKEEKEAIAKPAASSFCKPKPLETPPSPGGAGPKNEGTKPKEKEGKEDRQMGREGPRKEGILVKSRNWTGFQGCQECRILRKNKTAAS